MYSLEKTIALFIDKQLIMRGEEYIKKEYKEWPAHFVEVDRIARSEYLYFINPDYLAIVTKNDTGGGTVWHILDVGDFLDYADRMT